jgi:hypothetical protein
MRNEDPKGEVQWVSASGFYLTNALYDAAMHAHDEEKKQRKAVNKMQK